VDMIGTRFLPRDRTPPYPDLNAHIVTLPCLGAEATGSAIADVDGLGRSHWNAGSMLGAPVPASA